MAEQFLNWTSPVTSTLESTPLNKTAQNSSSTSLEQNTILYIWAGLALPLLYIGALGNLLTIIVIIRSRWWKTGVQVLVASITVADFLGTFITYPHQLINILCGPIFPWTYRPFCRLTGYILICTYYLVPLHCCMIALNRFICIVLPVRFKILTSKRAGIIMAAYCWALPLVLFSLPLAEVDGLFMAGKPFGFCTWAGYRGSRTLSYLVTASTIYIPTVVIFFCYFAIFIYLKNADRRVFHRSPDENGAAELELVRRYLAKVQRRVQVAKMMLITFLVFIICYVPLTSFFYLARNLSAAPNPTVFLWLLFLFWLSACCNTIIYALMNKDFRDAYSDLLWRLRRSCTIKRSAVAPKAGVPDSILKPVS